MPKVNWNEGKFYVNYYDPRNANPYLRARAEVSIKEKEPLPELFFRDIAFPACSHF